MTARPRYFGTDGIRAPFGTFPLDEPTVTALGYHLGRRLGGAGARVVLGGDTRSSTPELGHWLVRGLQAAGARWEWLGVVPTPAVAFETVATGSDAGIAVSASHNLFPDNGLKLFDRRGLKWAPAAEADLEKALAAGAPPELPDVEPTKDAAGIRRYLDHLLAGLPERCLAGATVVLDGAHGATAPFAPDLFGRLGADVHAIGVEPDGTNINRDCGSTSPAALEAAVRTTGADFGFGFDGDGDRCLLVDETGTARDGDALLYRWALELAAEGRLEPRAIVATSMSNLGLEQALVPHGVEVVRCGVGDREVAATMRERGIVLGGEQSGHLVCSHFSTTGDGLLTALRLAELLRRDGRPVARQLAPFRRFPQVLENVRVRVKTPFDDLPDVRAAVHAVQAELGDAGRLVLRYSGTEPLARIMLEGPEEGLLREWAERIAGAIRAGQPASPVEEAAG